MTKNTKIWLLLVATAALFFAGCAAQIQQNEMARARALANGDERLAALYYMQMEQNRVNAIMQMSRGLQHSADIIAASTRYQPQVVVLPATPALPSMQIPPPPVPVPPIPQTTIPYHGY
jgi:hypothetical protein